MSLNEVSGAIFNIQRYSLHDGPGIRTLVFFKDCGLRCRWCSNPESFGAEPGLFFVPSRCIGCLACAAACPSGEVTVKDGKPLIHRDKCDGSDFNWVEVCPTNALSVKGRTVTVSEAAEEVQKDIEFYRVSGGGVTLSGGEPLLQSDFAADLLGRCKAFGIHTAVETAGAVLHESFEAVFEHTDLWLYDVKLLDREAHKQWTGSDNAIILKNLEWLVGTGAEVVVRMPLIPGVNDDDWAVCGMSEYLKQIGVKRYDVLNFHQLGAGKYASCGLPYTLAELKPLPEARVGRIRAMIREAGFICEYE